MGAAIAGGVALALHANPLTVIVATTIGTVFGTLPDKAELNGLLPHRKPTHSLLAVAGLYVALRAAFGDVYAIAFTSAYASHLLLDALTVQGIWWLYPLPWRLRLLPLRTGGIVDKLAGLGAALAVLCIVGATSFDLAGASEVINLCHVGICR